MISNKLPNKTPGSIKEYVDYLDQAKGTFDDDSLDKKTEYEKEITTLMKLCSHPNIETVWKRLKKRKPLKSSSKVNKDHHLLMYALKVRESLERPKWDYLKITERLDTQKKLLSNLRRLSGQLKNLEISPNVFKLFSEKELEVLLIKNSNAKNEGIPIFMKYMAALVPISLSELLNRCANEMEENSYYKQVANKQPNRENADFMYFARSLANYNKEAYGKYLYEITALVSDIFFPDLDVDEKKISKCIK